MFFDFWVFWCSDWTTVAPFLSQLCSAKQTYTMKSLFLQSFGVLPLNWWDNAVTMCSSSRLSFSVCHHFIFTVWHLPGCRTNTDCCHNSRDTSSRTHLKRDVAVSCTCKRSYDACVVRLSSWPWILCYYSPCAPLPSAACWYKRRPLVYEALHIQERLVIINSWTKYFFIILFYPWTGWICAGKNQNK